MILRPPQDGWGFDTGKVVRPRAWQAQALPVLLRHYSKSKPESGIVSAIMGSGKARMIAQFLANCQVQKDEVIIVSAPTILLVQQLEETIRGRLDSNDFMGGPSRVGTYYTESKDSYNEIVIACTPSLPALAERIKAQGRKCVLWICDEAHTTQCKTIHESNTALAPERLLGFTATPFLADEKKSLSLFDKLLYKLTAGEAMRDGIVCGWKIVQYTGEGAGEDGVTLNSACIAMTKDAVGPVIFNAKSIQDAEAFATELRQSGKTVAAIHSQMPRDEVKQRMADLEQGRLWAVVHVRLLTVGWNFPSIRSMCLRRPMSSRVDFAQFLGRGMRSCEGKSELIVYDPHDLMSLFSITPEEALGGVADLDDSELSEAERTVKQLNLFGEEMMKSISKSRSSNGKMPLDIKPIQTYLTTLVNAFDVCGLIERKILGRKWRSEPASKKQATTVSNMGWVPGARRCVPRQHQRALSLLSGKYESREEREKYAVAMSRGVASDLISVLKSLGDKKEWPDIKSLDAAVSDAMKKTDEIAARPKLLVSKPETKKPDKPAAPALQQGMLFDTKRPKVSGG